MKTTIMFEPDELVLLINGLSELKDNLEPTPDGNDNNYQIASNCFSLLIRLLSKKS